MGLRMFVSLPLGVWHAKGIAKQELLIPRLKVLQNSMMPSLVARCRQANMSHDQYMKEFKKEVGDLFYMFERIAVILIYFSDAWEGTN